MRKKKEKEKVKVNGKTCAIKHNHQQIFGLEIGFTNDQNNRDDISS